MYTNEKIFTYIYIHIIFKISLVNVKKPPPVCHVCSTKIQRAKCLQNDIHPKIQLGAPEYLGSLQQRFAQKTPVTVVLLAALEKNHTHKKRCSSHVCWEAHLILSLLGWMMNQRCI